MTNVHLSGRRLLAAAGIAMLAIAAVIAVMAISANAASTTIGAKTVKVGSRSEPIAVNAKGVAVYTLSGDSPTHMLCTKANGCFSVWPPVTVHGKATIASGVKGKLGTFTRDGFTQVTLDGHPLYTFAGDGGTAGKATGDGIKSFGGTWHVVVQGKATVAKAPSSSPGSPQPSSGSGW